MDLKAGIYEALLNEAINKDLQRCEDKDKKTDKIDKSKSNRVLAAYLEEVTRRGLSYIKGSEEEKLQKQIDFCNGFIKQFSEYTGDESLNEYLIDEKGELLLEIMDKNNPKYALGKKPLERPSTSIAENSLFTGSSLEPSLANEIQKEIKSADKIDMLVSFIKWTGLRTIIEELKEFTKDKKLRIITTTYIGATDAKAIEELSKLPNTELRISYDTKRTKLHAKSYLFYRETGFSTAYIGSSNMSKSALTTGLEWNVKLSENDSRDILNKFIATFESYWNDEEFEEFREEDLPRLKEALHLEKNVGKEKSKGSFNFDIYPYSYQREILERLEAEREVHNKYRNLVIAATGTGKTIISAFDYKRFCIKNKNSSNRLLFVAHRKEILEQSINCFRGILKDENFGNLWVGEHKPTNIDHLFASVQTFNSRNLTDFTANDFYDFIIIDEFHHAAADSYRNILDYYKPKILLGLTATPERMDGKHEELLSYFDNRFAAEIRLGEAINRRLLSPFQYFAVSDNVDISHVKWARGGYDSLELSKVYSKNTRRASLVAEALAKYTADLDEVKGIGFCVSREHAKFMADFFNEKGIEARALDGNSDNAIRSEAKSLLTKGEIKFVFVVDIYNEGVDIPEVNTVMLLRPTQSMTIFLQQIGRGLRFSEGKECLTILDFVGQAHKKYNFEHKFRALLGKTNKSIKKEIEAGFPNIPKGCFLQLEKKAENYILENIKSSITSGKRMLISKIKSFVEETHMELNLANFVQYYEIELHHIYSGKYSFYRLCVEAGVVENEKMQDEKKITSALSGLIHLNSRRLLKFYIDVMETMEMGKDSFNNEEKSECINNKDKMLLMLHYTIWRDAPIKCGFNSIEDSLSQLYRNRPLFHEILEIFKYNYSKIDFVDKHQELGFDYPLDLHCKYSRDQVLSAFDYYTFDKKPAMREGVLYIKNKKLDIFFITLNKSDKDYSPSTLYEDYAINEKIFHWQSQSTTSSTSNTGQRYIHHKEMGSKVVLFVREYKKEFGTTSPYYFLGQASYIEHSGDKPMSIKWRLKDEIPSFLIGKTNRLLVK